MLSSKCAVCDSKKLRFIKNQEASGLLSSSGIKISLSKVPIVDDILFKRYKINEIINKFLLSWDKFTPEMHLIQPEFTYSVCRPLLIKR